MLQLPAVPTLKDRGAPSYIVSGMIILKLQKVSVKYMHAQKSADAERIRVVLADGLKTKKIYLKKVIRGYNLTLKLPKMQ